MCKPSVRDNVNSVYNTWNRLVNQFSNSIIIKVINRKLNSYWDDHITCRLDIILRNLCSLDRVQIGRELNSSTIKKLSHVL